ncbi:MAG TPA: ribosome biogenesis GTPase YlqF, partial [Candidatus Merdicola faecigallinarum]|nr:ribosome biogenesis GTPase YlqF [Candidatus Merdicola faecigallinarum]
LKLIDVVIELVDSRIPISSRNPDIKNMTKGKKKVIVFNKSDLADQKETLKWVQFYKKQGIPAVITDSNSGRGIQDVIKEVEKLMEEEIQKNIEKGRVGRKIRVMVLGIPNVGKSSFINRIVKKNSLAVGNRPGVTREKQWIRVNEKIELLDTPGVLWPKFESEEVALNLAYTGTIKDDILEKVEIAFQLLRYLLYHYQENVTNRYSISKEEITSILEKEQEENVNIYEIMQLIGRKRGAIVSGGRVDDEKVANLLIDDYRTGKLGKITLEKVKE